MTPAEDDRIAFAPISQAKDERIRELRAALKSASDAQVRVGQAGCDMHNLSGCALVVARPVSTQRWDLQNQILSLFALKLKNLLFCSRYLLHWRNAMIVGLARENAVHICPTPVSAFFCLSVVTRGPFPF